MSRLTGFTAVALLVLSASPAFAQAPARSDSTKKKAAAAAVPSFPTCGGSQCQSKLTAKSTGGTANKTAAKAGSKNAAKGTSGLATGQRKHKPVTTMGQTTRQGADAGAKKTDSTGKKP